MALSFDKGEVGPLPEFDSVSLAARPPVLNTTPAALAGAARWSLQPDSRIPLPDADSVSTRVALMCWCAVFQNVSKLRRSPVAFLPVLSKPAVLASTWAC